MKSKKGISFVAWFFIILILIIIAVSVYLQLNYGIFSDVFGSKNQKGITESFVYQENEDSSSENDFNIFSLWAELSPNKL